MNKKVRLLPTVLILLGIFLLISSYIPLVKDEVWFFIKEIKGQSFFLPSSSNAEHSNSVTDSPFARLLSTRPIEIEPVNKDFSIVIERIGVNAPVVIDVPVTDKKAYIEALRNGVAHAALSQYPSKDPGNVYLFAHASTNFWDLGRYATVFNLLRKLEIGDRVHIFYNDQTFVYEVVNKEVLKGWNTYPITRPVIEPTLTLQTCDPPGTTINRLVVTSKLIEVK